MQRAEFEKYKLVLSDPTHPAYNIALKYVLDFAENAMDFQESNQRELIRQGDLLQRIRDITVLVIGLDRNADDEAVVNRAVRFIKEEGGRYGG